MEKCCMHRPPDNGIVLHGMQCVMVHSLITVFCSQVKAFHFECVSEQITFRRIR